MFEDDENVMKKLFGDGLPVGYHGHRPESTAAVIIDESVGWDVAGVAAAVTGQQQEDDDTDE